MSDSADPDGPRITDLSSIEPETFKFRNTEFLKSDAHPYDNPRDRAFSEQRADIWRVRNGDIERVLEEFPTDRVKSARDESHEVRSEIPSVHLDTLYEKYELYRVWLRFFTDVLPDEYC